MHNWMHTKIHQHLIEFVSLLYSFLDCLLFSCWFNTFCKNICARFFNLLVFSCGTLNLYPYHVLYNSEGTFSWLSHFVGIVLQISNKVVLTEKRSGRRIRGCSFIMSYYFGLFWTPTHPSVITFHSLAYTWMTR